MLQDEFYSSQNGSLYSLVKFLKFHRDLYVVPRAKK